MNARDRAHAHTCLLRDPRRLCCSSLSSSSPRGTASIQSRRRRRCQRAPHIAVRMLARHGTCELVARRRPLPDLSALLRGRERRRHRRPARLTARLDHLEGLGVTASGSTRLSPRPTTTGAMTSPTTSPSIPDLGTLEDLDELIAEAASAASASCSTSSPTTRATATRGSRTRSATATPRRDFYVWADPEPDGRRRTTG